jgi:hypothetical protein
MAAVTEAVKAVVERGVATEEVEMEAVRVVVAKAVGRVVGPVRVVVAAKARAMAEETAAARSRAVQGVADAVPSARRRLRLRPHRAVWPMP